jgi:hypothetical protein
MLMRPLLFAGVLAAAAVIPYVLLDERLSATAKSQWNRFVPANDKQPDVLAAAQAAAEKAHAALAPKAPTAPPVAIEEAFRFDVTPAWVTSRWPRVSTVAGEPKQLGMRVPLVSGTQFDDIAGSLTYYFDEHHQLQRITFTGLTGDPRRLLAATVIPYGLQSQPTTHAAHYTAGDPKKPTSQVTVRHLPVVSAAARVRAEVAVDLRRSGANAFSSKAPGKTPIQSEPSLLPTSYRRW